MLVSPLYPERQFGAVVTDINLESLDQVTAEEVKTALYTHNLLLFKNQGSLSPRAQYELNKVFEPTADTYGHGSTPVAQQTKSVLHPDLKTIPHQPQVQVIGNGYVEEFEGLKNITLKHPHHKTFHADAILESDERDNTRFYRWHIDAALYGLHPPRVTTLMAVSVPDAPRQQLRYDDGTGDKIQSISRGSTVFVSGEEMYERLSPKDQHFVRTTRVQYAPHPYVWMANCRSRPDGLGLLSEGRELDRAQLPPIDEDKIQVLPMVWRNPSTNKLALQVHPSAVEKLHLEDGSLIDDLNEVRSILHRLQRPGIAPEHVVCIDWQPGDLALFNNHGVLHSVTGSFGTEEVRIFRQCNLASSQPPMEP